MYNCISRYCVLSLHCRIVLKLQIELHSFSQKSQTVMHIWGVLVPGPGPVHGPWTMETPIFEAVRNRESSPRCVGVSPQRVKMGLKPTRTHLISLGLT